MQLRIRIDVVEDFEFNLRLIIWNYIIRCARNNEDISTGVNISYQWTQKQFSHDFECLLVLAEWQNWGFTLITADKYTFRYYCNIQNQLKEVLNIEYRTDCFGVATRTSRSIKIGVTESVTKNTLDQVVFFLKSAGFYHKIGVATRTLLKGTYI